MHSGATVRGQFIAAARDVRVPVARRTRAAVRTSSTVTPCSAPTVSEFSPALIMLAMSTMRAPLLTKTGWPNMWRGLTTTCGGLLQRWQVRTFAGTGQLPVLRSGTWGQSGASILTGPRNLTLLKAGRRRPGETAPLRCPTS